MNWVILGYTQELSLLYLFCKWQLLKHSKTFLHWDRNKQIITKQQQQQQHETKHFLEVGSAVEDASGL